MLEVFAWFCVLLVPCGPLTALTALGAQRRGNPWVLAALAGVVFPLTWVQWYVRDELPLRRAGGASVPRISANDSQ